MKFIHTMLRILLMFSLLLNSGIQVFAMNTGFSAEELAENDKNTFISNVNITLLKDEPDKKSIQCFDVNDEGVIAIGQNISDKKIVSIYSQEGVFQYAYVFNCSGSFGVEWDKENLNIYFVRSDIIISVDSDGTVLEVKDVPDTIENNSYINHFIHSAERTIGDTKYLLKNDMGVMNLFSSSYSQLVSITPTGEERIIYDVNSMHLTKMIVIISLICVFVFVAVAVVIWQFIKLRRGD